MRNSSGGCKGLNVFFRFRKEMVSNIRYIGNYDINAEGKFLWEILCQLRNFGVGRIVTKNEWERKWPKQPSYLKIVQVKWMVDIFWS